MTSRQGKSESRGKGETEKWGQGDQEGKGRGLESSWDLRALLGDAMDAMLDARQTVLHGIIRLHGALDACGSIGSPHAARSGRRDSFLHLPLSLGR